MPRLAIRQLEAQRRIRIEYLQRRAFAVRLGGIMPAP